MNLKANYQKLKKHLRSGGIFYAFWRGIKYIVFLIKRYNYNKTLPKRTLRQGTLKVICTDCGISLYWDNIELNKSVGFNTVLYAQGKWHNSSQAKWDVIEKNDKVIMIRNKWRDLPISQIWKIELKNPNLIRWEIEMEIEKSINIEQKRIVIFLSERYKRWFNSYEEGEFSRITGWQAVSLDNYSSRCIGVKSPKEEHFLPAILFDFSKNDFEIIPVIQNSSKVINARCLEARIVDKNQNKRFLPGRYKFFQGEICLFEEEDTLDRKIEEFRQNLLKDFDSHLCAKKIKKEKHFKVLLVNLPWQKNGRWGVRAGSRWPHIKDATEKDYLPFPFFLAYAASLLRKNNIEVYLVDAIAEELSEEAFLSKLNTILPDLLVVETSTPSLEDDLNLLKKLKKINKDASITLCGSDVNIRSLKFLKENEFIDYVLVGEYEYTLLDLVQRLNKKESLDNVLGLVYRDKNGEIKINPLRPLIDLNTLPWPLREELLMESYIDTVGQMPLPSVQMIASRGCPFNCSFCLWPQVMYQGRNYRIREINDVVDEMEYLVKDMGFKSVYFDDDTFNIGRERMLKFYQEIKRRNLQDIPWAIMARPDLMDKDILKEMKSAGLWAVKYGVESFVQELVDKVGKNMDLKKSKDMIRFTQDLGIKTHLTFTFGLPGETKETIHKTIESCLELDPYSVQFSITTPFPGTEYFADLDKKGLIQSKNWSDYDGNRCSVISTENLTAKQLEEAKHYAYKLWQEYIWQRNFKTICLRDYYQKFLSSLKNKGIILTLYKSLLFILFKFKYLIQDKSLRLKRSLTKEGFTKTTKKIIRQFNPYNLRDRYLEIMGIMDGSYAYKGPSCVQIDLTNNCNNNCIGCWCNSPLLNNELKEMRLQEKEQILPFGLVKDLIDELHNFGTKELFFSGGGEPFLHPALLRIIQYAKRKKMLCYINTNFTLVDKKIIKELIDLRIDFLTVSLWAGTAKTYVNTHPNKDEVDFHRIYDMLKTLNNSKSNSTPYVKIYNVICNFNYQELEEMIHLGIKTKSEAVEFAVIDTIPGVTDKLLLSENQREEVLEQCNLIREKCDGNNSFNGLTVTNLDNFIRRLSDLGAKKGEYDSEFIDNIPCYTGWLFARILANGDVNSCLKSHRFPVGNIYKQSFREIWNSSLQREFRQKTLNKNDSFFSIIGNDPNCKMGCYKSCDNLGQNLQMHHRINNLSLWDKVMIKILVKNKFVCIRHLIRGNSCQNNEK